MSHFIVVSSVEMLLGREKKFSNFDRKSVRIEDTKQHLDIKGI